MIKQTEIIMGMPITLIVHDGALDETQIKKVFALFRDVDAKYSPYRSDSQVSQLQGVPLLKRRFTAELAGILKIAEQTKQETDGYFDVEHDGVFDPSGIVKGWAIQKAAELIETWTPNFYIEAGGDIQVRGVNESGQPWQIGVRNPFERAQNVAVMALENHAIATSGTAIRGQHIYDPVTDKNLEDIVSVSVIAPHIIDADRMATAAFAMGEKGITFLERVKGFEAFMINRQGISTQTTGWHAFEVSL